MSMDATVIEGMLPAVGGMGLRGLVLLAAAGLIALGLRRSSAALRHLVWTTALAGVLALPALVALTPDVPVLRLGAWPAASVPVASPAGIPVNAPVVVDDARPARTASEPAGSVVAPGGEVVAEAPTAATSAESGSRFPSAALPVLLLVLWAAGVVLLLAPVGAGWIAVRRLGARSTPLADPRVGHLATRLALRIGLKREFRLLEGPSGIMPMTWGILRPVVVLPPESADWPAARLEAVLLHELAHVRRRDCLTQLLAEVVRALHWFDPLAWVAAARLRAEREHACDDIALAGGARPSDYAGELLGLAREYRASRASTLAAVAMARPGQLAGRLLAVLEDGRARGWPGRAAALRTMAALGALSLLLAAAAPAAEAGQDAAPTTGALAEAGANAPFAMDATPGPVELPTAAAVTPMPLQEPTCAAADRGWRNVQHQSNDDRSTITMSRPGCDIEVRFEGSFDLDADGVAIARLGRDARLRIEENDGRVRRYLEVTPGAGGAPQYDYRVDRRQASFDAGARAWYQAVLLQLFRRSGFAAEQRVDALLRRGGVEDVLRELGHLESSHTFARYAGLLLERAQPGEAELRALIRTAARRLDSDHYMAGLLIRVADHQRLDGGILDDVVQASTTLDSDHYRASVLSRVLAEGRLSATQTAAVLESAAGLNSDHYLSNVLQGIDDRYVREPGIRQAYLRAAAEMESDHYQSRVLGRLLARADLSAAERAELLAATAGIESDHYRSELLRAVARQGLAEEPLQRAYFRALAGIASDHYGTAALRELIRQDRLPADLLGEILVAARGIESDHYLSELLVEIARGFRLDGALRDTFMATMDTIGSSHYRGRVADALLRSERR